MSEIKLIHEIARLAKELGILHETRYRNLCIREDFERMKKANKKVEAIELELAEKYIASVENIHKIVYKNY
ncbi:MAG: hypothetical protein A2V66_03635 [Ignavibacteria bacterium RBG_13_36_8]|nr:MAG: hypothetical protein A2V66_03635 [Ignavibacteria bacterium RBG_13_36_8]